ncbi:kinesin-like protein KIN-7E, chloroplastic [Selaginella moellendorffii]|uniref:kinesin-like protein KIN-7E, chloroplastic n=1 Tax=Selaginella moellendorffii TaxID=88036 RepID=UPI000D1C5AAF|nr:kinesin-like protein KIN-7E, chloroplastic [Selaginella moellendorffii]|eukprot:XP_024525244.1 kinesin-like protein KIN-7E, chloroplastic [Selaginella moellendorffii]
MASTSASSRRSSSPFRFRRPSSVNGRIPGFQPASPSSISSPSSTGRASLGGGGGGSHRSLTPTRSRSSSQALMTPPSMKYSSFNGGSSPFTPSSSSSMFDRVEFINRAKESISVTVRFRPLSSREIQKGDEVAWYADGDTTVRSEYNLATFYAFDRVFGPATTTRGVYDIAAQHVVAAAMQGVNGTVFAYGVTSSGKTHTMHGDQKSPGIIPLAVKDVFSIIQDTPGREFLLRVSYLEIYNEVINDLLDPAGQNLRVREDAQGTYVEGIKEEVVLSPAHALSLIAAGEEHRHVGSNNFNLFSSRSHTIFTLTIESSCRGEDFSDDEITLSQLNLIDLAGSESSKTETTGLRRKEGSYINKSLLTLGTVISKLSDGKASHIPYRDSKLTRLLQSSLSGHGRISLICTITPASSSTEETHNTLKFAQRAKRVELHAAPNRILDEKSLIKKYQKEITHLKQELEQLRRGLFERPFVVSNHDDLLTLRQQLEAGHLKMQSRLEEEEQAKAALMGRIQRLTKLILVSTKNTIPLSLPEKSTQRRRHSFGEEELAYLPDKRREVAEEEDDSTTVGPESEISGDGNCISSNPDDASKEEKKIKKRGMLGWFKQLKKHESMHAVPEEHTPSGSSVSFEPPVDFKSRRRKSFSRKPDELPPIVDPFPEPTQAGELFSATVRGRRPPPTGTTMADQMDLLREQMKMLAGEVALCSSSLKRLSEQAVTNPEDDQLHMQMRKLKEEIDEKRRQMSIIEKRIAGSAEASSTNASGFEMSQTISKLISQLHEKAFELEIKSADNRILQEQLQSQTNEINELQETVVSLRQELQASLEKRYSQPKSRKLSRSFLENGADDLATWLNSESLSEDLTGDSDLAYPKDGEADLDSLRAELMEQAAELTKLKKDYTHLLEVKDGLYLENQNLNEEASYAKELASAAAVELKHLADEVTKLSLQNSKLNSELAAAEASAYRTGTATVSKANANKMGRNPGADEDILLDDCELLPKESSRNYQELEKKLEESRQREVSLESDLANMWVLVAKLKKEKEEAEAGRKFSTENGHTDGNGELTINEETEQWGTLKELKVYLKDEKQRVSEMERFISQLKSENLEGLDIDALEDLQNLHVEALTKLCQTKTRIQEEKERESSNDPAPAPASIDEIFDEDRGSHVCKICFEAPTAAVLLPCRHFCLCKPCAVACSECPLCRSSITDRIITYTS